MKNLNPHPPAPQTNNSTARPSSFTSDAFQKKIGEIVSPLSEFNSDPRATPNIQVSQKLYLEQNNLLYTVWSHK